ncbi:MAG: DUF4091 domain-containing protein [Sphingobacteriales bacterium]|nr:DUF4091 domain-containing protein [Sphingobacteriales bacterium]
MMKKLFTAFFCLMFFAAEAQVSPAAGVYYKDPVIPSSAESRWSSMSNTVEASFAGSDTRFAKDIVPAIPLRNEWHASSWKGEKVHTQILVWTKQDIPAVKYTIGELKTLEGNIIPAGNIQLRFVRYVITDEFAGGCGYRKPQDFDSSTVADVIDAVTELPVNAKNVQPMWLSIEVPQDAAPGLYRGMLTINASKTFRLSYSITVKDHILPPPSAWSFHLDLWQHPAAIARVHDVPLWSDQHFELMRPYYTMLASAGQKCITAAIMDEPWGHQTYDDFPGLIKWTKHSNGSWSYDYTLFDKYVSFVMDCGIKQSINCYSMVPWATSFRYFDEAAQKDTVLKAAIGSPEYNVHWTRMLNDFTKHLKAKGWFNITTIAMDERPMKDMMVVISLLNTIDPKWKIALAGDYHPQIEKYIYDYCLASAHEFPPAVLQKRLQEGKPSTYYTCCTENYPNGFTFSPPDENVWIGWYAAAKGFTGYLRWAYNSWVATPLIDSRFKAWPAGDTYQVYPGPRTSIRFEKLIEGIQDFEKIRILRESFIQKNDKASLQKLDALLKTFDIQKLKSIPAKNMVDEAQRILNNW